MLKKLYGKNLMVEHDVLNTLLIKWNLYVAFGHQIMFCH